MTKPDIKSYAKFLNGLVPLYDEILARTFRPVDAGFSFFHVYRGKRMLKHTNGYTRKEAIRKWEQSRNRKWASVDHKIYRALRQFRKHRCKKPAFDTYSSNFPKLTGRWFK